MSEKEIQEIEKEEADIYLEAIRQKIKEGKEIKDKSIINQEIVHK